MVRSEGNIASSEVIGSLIMIGMLTALFGLVASILVSQQETYEIPSFTCKVEKNKKDSTSYEIIITHMRGDSIKAFENSNEKPDTSQTLYLLLDQIRYPIQRYGTSGVPKCFYLKKEGSSESNRDFFSIGDTLTGTDSDSHSTISFIQRTYKGSEYLLWTQDIP